MFSASRKEEEEEEGKNSPSSDDFLLLLLAAVVLLFSSVTLHYSHPLQVLRVLNLRAVYLAAAASSVSFCLSAHILLQRSCPLAPLQPAEEATDHL